MDAKIGNLLQEIQRQLNSLSEQSRHGYSSPNDFGVVSLQNVGESYQNQLMEFYQSLSRLIPGSQERLSEGSLPTPQGCLWGIAAFSHSSSTFLDPECLKDQCLNLQAACGLSFDEVYTDDIWESPQLIDWARAEQSSLMLVQGSYQSIHRLERFSAEVFSFLSEKLPTISILQAPTSAEFFVSSDEKELLRQLALQALQKVPVRVPVFFLADMLEAFVQASTCEHWFGIIEEIFQLFSHLCLVLNVSVLGGRVQNARTWPTSIQQLMARLQTKSSVCLRVLLVTTYPIWLESEALPLMSVGLAPEFALNHDGMSGVLDVPPQRYLPVHLPNPGLVRSEAPSPTQPLNATLRGADIERHDSTHLAPPPTRRYHADIAIFCALTLEADAVEALFDEKPTKKCSRVEGDTNTYSLGVIGRHNVVLVHMPGMGTRHAAAVAACCRMTFAGISLALVVGICGGVPFARDGTELLLGDVAISEGLVLYDFGRQFPDGFRRKDGVMDSARKLSVEILGFLAKLKGRNARKKLQERTTLYLGSVRQKLEDSAAYPGMNEDTLFDSAYRHKHQDSSTCAECATSDGPMGMVCDLARTQTCKAVKCDFGRTVARQRLNTSSQNAGGRQGDPDPAVHFGMYASGDKVMKSGKDRDQVAQSEGIIAFEMEGAGVWEVLPCLIIKGICDYADSHKSKKWQGYAAATAAACTKAFLEDWRG